jgi:hypothetical protein
MEMENRSSKCHRPTFLVLGLTRLIGVVLHTRASEGIRPPLTSRNYSAHDASFPTARELAMADKLSSALVNETWAQAARNTSGHQRDYVIEALKKKGDADKKRGNVERSTEMQRRADKSKSDTPAQ